MIIWKCENTEESTHYLKNELQYIDFMIALESLKLLLIHFIQETTCIFHIHGWNPSSQKNGCTFSPLVVQVIPDTAQRKCLRSSTNVWAQAGIMLCLHHSNKPPSSSWVERVGGLLRTPTTAKTSVSTGVWETPVLRFWTAPLAMQSTSQSYLIN